MWGLMITKTGDLINQVAFCCCSFPVTWPSYLSPLNRDGCSMRTRAAVERGNDGGNRIGRQNVIDRLTQQENEDTGYSFNLVVTNPCRNDREWCRQTLPVEQRCPFGGKPCMLVQPSRSYRFLYQLPRWAMDTGYYPVNPTFFNTG